MTSSAATDPKPYLAITLHKKERAASVLTPFAGVDICCIWHVHTAAISLIG